MPERRLTRSVILLAWALVLAAICAASFVPERSEPIAFPGRANDWNLYHIPAYALVSMTTALMIRIYWHGAFFNIVIASALFASLLGVGIEWLQPLVGRTQSLWDMGLNTLGVLLGIGAMVGMNSWPRSRV